MPCRYGTNADHRIRVELVEADFEIGFNLVDLVESRPLEAMQLLSEAERVYADILARVQRLEASESVHFVPLVDELRREIDLAGAGRGGNG